MKKYEWTIGEDEEYLFWKKIEELKELAGSNMDLINGLNELNSMVERHFLNAMRFVDNFGRIPQPIIKFKNDLRNLKIIVYEGNDEK